MSSSMNVVDLVSTSSSNSGDNSGSNSGSNSGGNSGGNSGDESKSVSTASCDQNTTLQTIFRTIKSFSKPLYEDVVLCGKRYDAFTVSERYSKFMKALFPVGQISHFVESTTPLAGEGMSPPHIAHQTMLYFVTALASLEPIQFRDVGNIFKTLFTRPVTGLSPSTRHNVPFVLRREHVVDICKLVTGHSFWCDNSRYSDNTDIMQAVLCFFTDMFITQWVRPKVVHDHDTVYGYGLFSTRQIIALLQ
jgi:hypothetical protein